MISLVIGTLLTALSPAAWLQQYIFSAVYTFSIGTPISVLFYRFGKRIRKLPPLKRIIASYLVFVSCGLIGTVVGTLIIKLILPATQWDLWAIVLYLAGFNVLIAVIVGTILMVYERIRQQYETSQQVLREKKVLEKELEHLKARAELKALQARINPHFLFNTLNSIASLIPENPELAEKAVEELADYFRKTLSISENIHTTAGEELALIKTYLDIEKIRFGPRLSYQIEVAKDVLDLEIPALTLQPLVENAVKYAVTPSLKGRRFGLRE
jgi:sensor histidine kinase YesM